jgi:hypothetical protein
MRGRKAFDSGFGASAGLSEVAQWPRLDRPEPRLQAAWHDNAVGWVRAYKLKEFPTDLVAGLSRAAFVIPESLAYASLARKTDWMTAKPANADTFLKAYRTMRLASKPAFGLGLNHLFDARQYAP